jgi:hypothetical protein
MTRVITVVATMSTLLVLLFSAPTPTEAPKQERSAQKTPKTKKGKIKPPHEVQVKAGTPLVLYLPADNLTVNDVVDPGDVTVDFTGYTILCTSSPVISDPKSTAILIKATFSVTKQMKKPADNTTTRKKDDEKEGTGDLTITLNTLSDRPTTVALKAFGE